MNLTKISIPLDIEFTGLYLIGKVPHECGGEYLLFHPDKKISVPCLNNSGAVDDEWLDEIMKDDWFSHPERLIIPLGTYPTWYTTLDEEEGVVIVRHILIGAKLYELPEVLHKRGELL